MSKRVDRRMSRRANRSMILPTAIVVPLLGLSAASPLAHADAARPDDAPRQEESAQPARPPLPPAPDAPPPPWARHIEIGGDVAYVMRPTSVDANGIRTDIRYEPTIGYGLHARWEIVRFLRFTGYFVSAQHKAVLPPGSLGLTGTLSLDTIETFAFGARLSPTIPWSARARTWLTAGVGWGRVEIGKMQVTEPGSAPFTIRERTASFAEIPLGIGTSFDIIPRWLAVEIEVTGAFVLGQEGESLQSAQAIDGSGRRRSIGSFPKLDASFVQTLGLSLIL